MQHPTPAVPTPVPHRDRAGGGTPAPRHFFPELEGMRGIAAVSVFIFHLWLVLAVGRVVVFGVDLTGIPSHGGLGVEFFFILSGFLLTMPWLRSYESGATPSWRTFAQRRLFRIVPAYYASFLLLAIWTAPPPPGYSAAVVTPGVLVAHAVFAPYLALAPALNGVYWSLSTEMQFYIALPLLALAFTGRRWMWGLLGCIAAALVWRVALYLVIPPGIGFPGVDANAYLNQVALPGRLDSFAVGMVGAALWLRYGQRKLPWLGPLVVLCGMLLVVFAINMAELLPAAWWARYLFEKTFFALGFGMVVIGTIFSVSVTVAIWRLPPLRWLGTISYSLYLWHLPICTALAAALGKDLGLPLPLVAAVITVAVFLASTASYYFIERPFLNGGNQVVLWLNRMQKQRIGIP